MRTHYNILIGFIISALVLSSSKTYAGNEDRAGQAGATQLLINPWSRSSGWAGSNVANCKGIESMFLNVAGTAFTRKTELLFTRTKWLVGSDININAFGFSQKVGESGALGLGVMAVDFGDIQITTTEMPEGGLGVFSPQFVNLGLSYAKGFSDNIYGGLTLKVISEGISDVKAQGIAVDAGIQYITGAYEQIKFGISLKNVGPRMRFQGDGLAFRTPIPQNTTGKTYTVENRSEGYELPSLVNIGGSYDFYFTKDSASIRNHRLTVAANFTANSFAKDEYRLGLEYGFKSFLMLRAGYTYEKGLQNKADRTTVFTGPAAGFTIEIPFTQSKSTFGLDYSYRATHPFQGTHSIGARINL